MAVVAGRNRMNRPYFFLDKDGDRVEFPSFGTGQGELVGNELRTFNMLVSAKQIDAQPPVPEAFGDDDWSVAADEAGIELTITALPDDNGSELTGIMIRVNGGYAGIIDPEASVIVIPADPGEYDVTIAAVSDAGEGPWSDPKPVEVV